MLESLRTDKFEYKRLSLEEQKQRGILGRLTGIIADTAEPTRNGRKYSSELWEKVFENPVMKEKIANHCLFGELGHPEDREEVDMEKIAICLAEQPKKGTDGKLYGVFDILSTPNGKLLKSLCDYGCNIGVSSRGTGDLYTDEDGNEAVDPDTYNCECWDAVLVPAVESARLKYVTESLDTKKYNKTLRQKLTEELNKASEEDKKVMEETLNDLDINLNEDEDQEDGLKYEALWYPDAECKGDFETQEFDNREDLMKFYDEHKEDPDKFSWWLTSRDANWNVVDDIVCESIAEEAEDDEFVDESSARVEDRSRDRVVNDDESISENCGDKECNEEVVDDKSTVNELQESLLQNKTLADDNLKLQEELSVRNAKEAKLEEELKKHREAIADLSEKAKDVKKLKENLNKLTEELDAKVKLSESLQAELDKVNSLSEEANKKTNELNDLVESLKGQLEESNNKLDESNDKLKKYRKAYASLKESYIGSKAEAYNISVDSIKKNLNESYSIKDIDSICEKLSDQKRSLNKLPFRIDENTSIGARSSKQSIGRTIQNEDDDISSLLKLTNL